MVINDKYFIENGYWKIITDTSSKFSYDIVSPTEKWRKLMDTCFRRLGGKGLITEELMIDVINNKPTRTDKYYYKKKIRPEGWISTKDKILMRKKEKQKGN